MRLKGVLRTPDCVYTLSPKITTIGRENCDLIIQNPTIDDQHAIIEFSEQEDMFILRDLDTNNGTYVNECRIQNASVRLSSGDTIRFGFQGVPHEFSMENPNQQVIYPPVTHQRPTWQSSHTLRVITDPTSASGGPGGAPLPHVFSQKVPISLPQPQPTPVFSAWTNVPHPPPAARAGRPSSAGRRQTREQPRGGWIGGQARSANHSPGRESPVSEIISPEKGEEKDGMIESLRQQIVNLQAQMSSLAVDTNVRTKLLQLEAEVAARRAEVTQLRDRLQQQEGVGTGPGLVDSLELTSVRSDLERLRKDKQITSGLVSQLQKDLSSKDATISRLTRQIESLQMESESKESNINNLHNAIKKEQERTRMAASTDARDKELQALRQKFKVAESKVQEQSGFIQSLKADLEAAHTELRRCEQDSREAEERMKRRDTELMDLQRVERIARVDMQEATKRYERLRNRTMQIAFSVGGIETPSTEVKDDQVIEMLKKILDERNEATEQLKVARRDLESKGSFRLELSNAVEKWMSHLTAMQSRLSEAKVPSGSLGDEITMLVTEPVHETLQPIKEAVIMALKLQLEWHAEIDSALSSCGINTKLSSERPKQHICDLNERLEAARAEAEEVRARLEAMTKEHQLELEKITASLTSEKDEALKVAEESAELSREEQVRQAVDEALIAEKNKFQEELDADKAKIEELKSSINTLQQTLVEKQEDYEARLKEAELNVVKVEALQATVDELEKELALSRADTQKFAERAISKASFTSPAASTAGGPEEMATLRSDLDTTRGELETSTVELESARVKLERLEAAEKANEDLLAEVERLRPLEEAVLELRATVGGLEVSKIDLEARVEALNAELEGHLSGQADASSRSASRLKADVDRLTQELEKLQGDAVAKDELEGRLEAAYAAKTDLESQLAGKAEELAALQAKVTLEEQSKANFEAQVMQLQAEVERLTAERPLSQASRRSSFAGLRAELDVSLARTLELTKEIEALRAEQGEGNAADEVNDLRQQLTASESAVTRLAGELELARSSACQLEEVEKLRADLEEARVALEAAKEVGRPREEAEAEVESFREQVRQHSLTICALEDRLASVMKENQELQGAAADLKRENRILRKKRGARGTESAGDAESKSGQGSNANVNVNALHTESSVEVPMMRPPLEIAALERSLLALRQENANLKKDIHEKQRSITALKHDLSGATALLSDVRSEMDEEQKQAVTDAKLAQTQAESVLNETREQLIKLSTIVDEQRESISSKDKEIKNFGTMITRLEATVQEQSKRIEIFQGEKTSSEEKMAEQLAQLEEQGRITSELTATGAQCRGERHDQIISHQKEALAELRLRVKKLEQVRAPLPSHDQAVQQVVLLKKELAEMRARQALQETRVVSSTPTLPAIGPAGANSNNLVNNSFGVIGGNTFEGRAGSPGTLEHMRRDQESKMEDERSAHRLTMAILEESEQTFLDLLRAVGAAMEMETIGGLRSMAHLSEMDRNLVKEERMQTIQKLCQRIKVLQDRLDRKENLMMNYEQDLVRLQQAEELAQRKHQQVETLVQDVRKKTDEAEMLRESLNNTKEILSREKMLNNAIKQKKTFHMEVPKMPKGPTPQRQAPKYHCPPPDPFNKADVQKKKAKERERRKDFEIETLKSKLTSREEELCRATTRLVSMETTLGLNREDQLGT